MGGEIQAVAFRRRQAVKTICERLTSRLGFQKQSMLNQEEHIEVGWHGQLVGPQNHLGVDYIL
jgi:hypothetical protein